MQPPFNYKKLDQRRARLKMPKTALATRARVSLPTINRILSGQEPNPTIGNLTAIAAALGLTIRIGASIGIEETESANEYRIKEARAKAKRLVTMVQGTMALEAQAIDGSDAERLVDQTTYELLNSKRRLWGE